MCSVIIRLSSYVERASLDLGLGGHRALKERVILHAGSVLVWFHDLRTIYVICVACLFRFIALRTSYVTCVACLFRLNCFYERVMLHA